MKERNVAYLFLVLQWRRRRGDDKRNGGGKLFIRKRENGRPERGEATTRKSERESERRGDVG